MQVLNGDESAGMERRHRLMSTKKVLEKVSGCNPTARLILHQSCFCKLKPILFFKRRTNPTVCTLVPESL